MKRGVVCLILCLMFCFGCGHKELPSVNIFFTADIEGVFWSRPEPRYGNEITGGLSILKSFISQQTSPFLLLEGGNWFSQTPEGTLSQGDYFNSLAATIPYAARLFTQKDLMYGWGSLSHILKNSPAPFVLSNVTQANGTLPAGAKAWLEERVGDYKIGIVGLVGQQAFRQQQRVGGLKITDPVEAARRTVQTLRDKGAQAIIVLSALGVDADKNALTEEELAQEVSGIDVIITSDKGRENADINRVDKTWIVYPGSRLDSVGRIQLFFTKNGEVADAQFEDIVLYRRDFGEDKLVAEEIASLRRLTQQQMTRLVGNSEQELTGKLDGESELGDWAADCLRKWAKADAAILNSSSLRAALPAGAVNQYDLYNLYPYSDNVTYLTIKGSALLKALEDGLSIPDNFAQISGLQIKYNPQRGAGKRISSVQINGKPLQNAATYRVAITDYMLSGGAGHDSFIDSLEFKNTQVEMHTVLRLCFSDKKPLPAPKGERWSVVK